MTIDSFEIARRAEKAERQADLQSHPFGRHLNAPTVKDLVFDDEADSPIALVVFADAAYKVGIAPVQLFNLVEQPVRRIFIRGLRVPAPDHSHPLGNSVAEVQASLRTKLTGHSKIVFLGASLGGFHALLHGTLLKVSSIFAAHPTTTVLPSHREAFGDNRVGGTQPPTPEFLEQYGDIAAVWQTVPPRRTVVHYPYRIDVYRQHAEHIAGFPQVRLIPHYENGIMQKLAEDGTLRRYFRQNLVVPPEAVPAAEQR